MTSVSQLAAELSALQRKLVEALQAEYFTDDLELPKEAFGWDESRLRDFFEAGGEVDGSPPPVVDRSPGRPSFVCLGDGVVELASHSLTAESVKHEKSPPLASELLVSDGPAAPILEQGPGWLGLLARDYAWRATADVVNRGHSGYTSRLALADLPELIARLPVSRSDDVCAVLLQFGCADASAEGDAHVPADEYEAPPLRFKLRLAALAPNGSVHLIGCFLNPWDGRATCAPSLRACVRRCRRPN